MLAKLLVVGITDSEPDVRFSVLDCLNDCFDFHLAQAENISALFIAMNDEQFEIRELAVCIIGRLSILNPAYIMPSLRVTLIQLLIQLEHSGMGRNKEQAARLLGHLVANAPKLIRSYVEPILKVLIPKLKEPDVSGARRARSAPESTSSSPQRRGTALTSLTSDELQGLPPCRGWRRATQWHLTLTQFSPSSL